MKLKIKYNNSSNNFENININKKIGEGKSGSIYEININNYTYNNDYVIKILKNGNRFEYDFYNNFIEIFKEDTISLKIGLPICYGRLLNNFKEFNMKNKFLIFHKYKRLTLKNIKGNTEKDKILNLIYNLLKVELFLEQKLNFVNLDIKLDNIMLDNENNIKVIDLGLIKNYTKGDIFYGYSDYIIWPTGKCYLNSVPLYSIFIVICMLYFKDEFIQENNIFKLKKLLLRKIRDRKCNHILSLLIKKKHDSHYLLNYF